jgi:hypothetical protein
VFDNADNPTRRRGARALAEGSLDQVARGSHGTLGVVTERQLVGVREIAAWLGVSISEAALITDDRHFPERVTMVIPVDNVTRQALRILYETHGGSLDINQSLRLFEERAFDLPETPRLWRLTDVISWARAAGRSLRDPERPR